MRRMVNSVGTVVVVVEHIVLANMYEYYILADEPDTHAPDPDMVYALVIGDGRMWYALISLPEIEPYILIRTTYVNSTGAPTGWRWSDAPVPTGV